ncbi:MAG: D-sedoheptulose 7-phosphate isomerase [Rhodospirillum sp.]|nr:D-sedoheptulose 7-phosphate isomerase [Rhodospirillum sp.]MCF8488234.1 D-sedoheptulose 7-phosphate isomerase [Rhodospirillum sp.]MCF8501242.1 D-sedoheptulose 7-phosphate isomerase [Rhodospirillum sp.]
MEDDIKSYCQEAASGFTRLADLAPDIQRAAECMIEAVRGGGKIMFCGNGGSAADAQHLAAELEGRYLLDRPPLPGMALTVNTSSLTAIGNDYGFVDVFARQLQAHGRRGDVLVALSTSGNSPNVVKAITVAREMGVVVVGLTGERGGEMDGLCSVCLKVPSGFTPMIQQMHIAVGHMLCGFVEEALAK